MEAQRVDDWGFTFPQPPSGAVPATTIDRDTVLELAVAKLAITVYEPAHNDSDPPVRFVDGERYPRRRHLLEMPLSVHRLFHGWKKSRAGHVQSSSGSFVVFKGPRAYGVPVSATASASFDG
jgi:hypothetical protein